MRFLFEPTFIHSATPWTDLLRGLNVIASVIVIFGILRNAVGRKVYRPYRAILLGVLFLGLAGVSNSLLRLGEPANISIFPFSAALYCCMYGVWYIRIDRAHGVRAHPEPMPRAKAKAKTEPDNREQTR